VARGDEGRGSRRGRRYVKKKSVKSQRTGTAVWGDKQDGPGPGKAPHAFIGGWMSGSTGAGKNLRRAQERQSPSTIGYSLIVPLALKSYCLHSRKLSCMGETVAST
jgi:hypothetical protein